jgi:hypothetical protein
MARLCRHGDLQSATFTARYPILAARRLDHFSHGFAPAFVYDALKVTKQALADNAS